MGDLIGLSAIRRLGHLDKPAQRIGEPHVVDRAPVDLEQPW